MKISKETNEDKKKFHIKRLIEDILNSGGRCSSGLVSNLVNALTDENNQIIKISFEDQINANIDGRMQKIICESDETTKTIVMFGVMKDASVEEKHGFETFIKNNA